MQALCAATDIEMSCKKNYLCLWQSISEGGLAV
jgi:hypothetical protein